MSVLTYNGVTLPMGMTTEFTQEPQYDPGSDTDWFCTEFTIGVQTIISTDYLTELAPALAAGATDNPAAIMGYIRSQLMQPRRLLTFTFNGINLIPEQTAGPGTVDVQNGPKPISCTCNQLTNTTFLMTYRIKARYWENNRSNTIPVENMKANPILYSRWTEIQDIDVFQLSTVIREGKFVIRSDNAQGFMADQFRSQTACVGLYPGMVRESASYTQSPDGLGISYRIIDRELFKMPPVGATRATGEYVETTVANGAHRWGECHVRLEGGKLNNQSRMIETGLKICSSKIRNNGAQIIGAGANARFGILEQAVIVVGMYDNWVDIRMRVRMKPAGKKRTDAVWQIDFEPMAFTPGTDGAVLPADHPLIRDYGSANVLLRAAAYYDPSLANSFELANRQLAQGLPVGQAGIIREQ